MTIRDKRLDRPHHHRQRWRAGGKSPRAVSAKHAGCARGFVKERRRSEVSENQVWPANLSAASLLPFARSFFLSFQANIPARRRVCHRRSSPSSAHLPPTAFQSARQRKRHNSCRSTPCSKPGRGTRRSRKDHHWDCRLARDRCLRCHVLLVYLRRGTRTNRTILIDAALAAQFLPNGCG
jgi:hypothetical protein